VLDVQGLTTFGTNHAANIRTDGTLWGGEVRDYQVSSGGYNYIEAVPMFDNTGKNGLGRVVHRSNFYRVPPRGGKWDAYCHILEMQFPAPGCFSILKCMRTGTYGTDTPPLWDGSDVVDAGSNSIGGYLTDNVYFSPITFS
jgi:hypothetical protein